MGAIGTFVGAIAALIAGLVLPMLIPTLPHVAQISLLVLAGILLIVGALLVYVDASKKKKNELGISVTMRDGNVIGQIGHTNERREEDR